MKVIDLLNKIANGEEVPKKIRIDHWCYNFEWKDYAGNYVDEDEDIDLMSALSCDIEELNYEIQIIEEDKKIEKLNLNGYYNSYSQEIEEYCDGETSIVIKINELIDEVNKLKGEKNEK